LTLTLEELIRFLLQAPLFERLTHAELATVVRILRVERYADGQVIFREDSPGDSWCVLYEGTALVTKAVRLGPARELARLEPPSCFGEMAILDRGPRSATVRAIGETTVLRFPAEPFDELLEGGALAAYKLVVGMARVLTRRQRELTVRFATFAGDELGEEDRVRRDLSRLLDRLAVSE